MFKPNHSLDKAILEAMRVVGHGVHERVRMRACLAFLPRFKREELERELTQFAKVSGAFPPEAVFADDIFVGSWWEDLLQFIIDNWEVILEMILAIITIFLSQE